MQRKNRLGIAVSAALGLTGLLSVPVIAQDELSIDDSEMLLEEVIVTGSRIVSEDGFDRPARTRSMPRRHRVQTI